MYRIKAPLPAALFNPNCSEHLTKFFQLIHPTTFTDEETQQSSHIVRHLASQFMFLAMILSCPAEMTRVLSFGQVPHFTSPRLSFLISNMER